MKIVISPAIDEDRLRQLQAAAPDVDIVNASSAAQALLEIPKADGFYGKLTPELLAEAKVLRWVQSPTASLEHYVFPELIAHPCVLTNMRGIFHDVIADHVLGLLLCFSRNLHTYVRQQSEHRWAPVGDPSATTDFVGSPGTVGPIDLAHRDLRDCTLGVVGVGSIGGEICVRAAAFGMRVCGVDPVRRAFAPTLPEVWPSERLEDLLDVSDFVVIAAPHTPETEKLFRAKQFRRMKRDAVLINIGRGAIVDLQDLTTALQTGEIAGAGLDVVEQEPLPTDHPLWDMENVILTPHVAAASPHVPRRHTETLIENFRRFAAGEPLLNVADKSAWF